MTAEQLVHRTQEWKKQMQNPKRQAGMVSITCGLLSRLSYLKADFWGWMWKLSQLRGSLVSPADAPGSVPRTHMVAHNHMQLGLWGICHSFLISSGTRYTRGTYSHASKTLRHISKTKKENILKVPSGPVR